MLGELIQLAALAVLFASLAYLLILILNNHRIQTAAIASSQEENNYFRTRVGEIMDRRQIIQAQEELSWQGFRKFQVRRKEMEGGDICSFYLYPHDERQLPYFEPGQYLTFKLDIPGQKKQTIRCYSLSEQPLQDYYRVSVKKIPPPRDNPEVPPGLGSNFFHNNIEEGDIIDVKAPSGHFFLDVTKPQPVVLIGGGIGLTPVLSMLKEIISKDWRSEVWFFYGISNGAEHIMKDHLKELSNIADNIKLRVCYSRPREEDIEGTDYDIKGRVGVDLFKEVLPSSNYHYYFCGPPPMMNSLFEDLREWKVPEDHLHYEAFGPATVKKKQEADGSKDGAGSDDKDAEKFVINFAKSDKSVEWSPNDGSILDFAEENDVDIEFGCRAGNCGTCITAVIEGNVDYLSEPGEMPETGSCLSCIAVPKGNITINA
ncbi:MAG: 2Fe-2S iron-sulfur cluster-binding protein [Pseudomonadota bacterium]|nr:2Fe-2S iron-sulfur cluster-binding protein [Pseudomonadota bacterium]